MKVAFVAPVEEAIPPTLYGGTEWIVYQLVHWIGKKGQKVDLYAAGDSKKEPFYNLIPIADQSIRHLPKYFENIKLRDVKKYLSFIEAVKLINRNNYDLIHNHASWRFLLLSSLSKTPVLTTHHGPLNIDYQREVFLKYAQSYHVSISNNQRRDLPQLNFVKTIYNGLDLSLFPFSEKLPDPEDNHLLFLARMSGEKGPIEAAQAAKQAQKKLIIATKVDKVNQEYFESFKPLIDNQYVFFKGEIAHQAKITLLQGARALLVPIKWEEPFGLMFTEAMACGVPVITFSRGSTREIIKDGVTGFLVNQSSEYILGDYLIKKTGVDGLAEAIKRIYSMPEADYKAMRQACRDHIAQNFTAEKMINEYEEVYKKIVNP